MLEFKKTEVEAMIYGVAYKLRRPTVREAQDYGKSVAAKGEQDSAMLLLELLEKCGLPVEVSEQMEAEHLVSLVEALMPSKKK